MKAVGWGFSLTLALSTAGNAVEAQTEGRPGWRFGVAAGPIRIDDLAGTPLVPNIDLHKAYGRSGIVGGSLGWVRDAGFYGLDALVLDVGLGKRWSTSTRDYALMAGPSGMVGGDGDGTPYLAAGAHLSALAIHWLGEHVGIAVGGTVRVWATTANARVMPGARLGFSFR